MKKYIKIERKNYISIIAMIVAVLLLTSYFLTKGNYKDAVETGTGIIKYHNTDVPNEFTPFLTTENETLEQVFQPAYEGLSNISIRLANEHPDKVNCVLQFRILSEKREVLWEGTLSSELIENWHYANINPEMTFHKGETYILQMGYEKLITKDVPFKAFLCKEDLTETRELLYNGEEMPGELDLMFYYLVTPYHKLLPPLITALFVLLLIMVGIRSNIKWLNWIYTGASAFYTLECVEYLQGNHLTAVSPVASIISFAMIATCFFLLLGLTKKTLWSALLPQALVLIFGVVNHFVLLFRDSVFLPHDIAAARTAMEVMGNYTFSLDYVLWITICHTIINMGMLYLTAQTVSNRRIFLIPGILLVILFSVYLKHPELQEKLSVGIIQSAQTTRSKGIGFTLNFIENIPYIVLRKPEGYSQKVVDKIYSELNHTEVSEVQAVKVIAIMAESMTDFTTITDLLISEDSLSTIHAIGENPKRGKVGTTVSSVFGGGTSCSEFEFLTGHTMLFLGSGNAPYQQFISSETDSLATIFGDNDFDTYSMHPAATNNWGRNVAYPLLGFDNYYHIQSPEFADSSYCRYWVDDKSLMEQLLLKNNAPGKQFGFAITIQCHGGYSYEGYESHIKLSGASTEYPEVEQYLSLLDDTDTQIGNLIANINPDEPTIVLVFGDHLPSFQDKSFYNDYYVSDMDSELGLKTTPYAFWSNYDVDYSDFPDIMSLNFLGSYLLKAAGIELDPYHEFLYELSKEYPIVSKSNIYDANGASYTYEKSSKCYDTLHQYQILQYNKLKK